MIQPLTVAIPTMRRYSFLQKSIPQYLENPLITAIVICDETGEDIQQIESQSWGKHPKLRLHKNPKRLGIYHNKRKCVEVSPTDWVALLDSDNIFPEEFFETLFDLWKQQPPHEKTVYASSEVVRVFQNTGESEDRTSHFAGMKITKSNWNRILETKGWNFLLNDGNFIAHKGILEYWPKNIEDKDVLATDAIRTVHHLILNGYTYFIVPELRYIHTVHDGSEWLRTDRESTFLLATTNWRI